MTGSCHPEEVCRYVTEDGCVVTSYRQVNAHGRVSEHVTLSVPMGQNAAESGELTP